MTSAVKLYASAQKWTLLSYSVLYLSLIVLHSCLIRTIEGTACFAREFPYLGTNIKQILNTIIHIDNFMLPKAMEKNGVIPDVISKLPPDILKVTYENINVNIGDVLKPIQVKNKPELNWKTDEGVLYSICMTDPDAPSRKDPKFREWHHWLVVNISKNDIKSGETLSEYIGAAPPKGTGLHRYVLLVYKQKERIKCDEKKLSSNSGAGRGKFSIKKFAEKYGLGDPIAGTFFLAEWDDYVPKIQKQLSGK